MSRFLQVQDGMSPLFIHADSITKFGIQDEGSLVWTVVVYTRKENYVILQTDIWEAANDLAQFLARELNAIDIPLKELQWIG